MSLAGEPDTNVRARNARQDEGDIMLGGVRASVGKSVSETAPDVVPGAVSPGSGGQD